jgi:hypothetical protein
MFNKLLDWQVPYALTSAEWRAWHAQQRAQRPIAYWFCETLPDMLAPVKQWFTGMPYNLRMRWINRYDVIRTGLPRTYHDGDTRMLHGMFAILVDFVEIEKAHMQYVFSENTDPRPWYARRPFRFFSHRVPEAGLEYLKWEMSLDEHVDEAYVNISQAQAAREIYDLYIWWTQERPLRVEPYAASGWNDYYRENYENKQRDPLDEHDSEQADIALKRLHDIEMQYDQQDQDYLIRLVKVRKHLWT